MKLRCKIGLKLMVLLCTLLVIGFIQIGRLDAANMQKGIQPGAPVDDSGNILISNEIADQLAATGAGYVRINFKLTPAWTSDTAEFYNAYDTIIDRLQARGLTVIGLLSNEFMEGTQNEWNEYAFECTGGDSFNSYIDRFGYQAARVMAHYRNTREVRYWEIWNEPNSYAKETEPGKYEGGSFIYPSIFSRLLGHVYSQVKYYTPMDVVIISGGLLGHNIGGNENEASAGADYLRATYQYGINHGDWNWMKANTGSYPLDHIGYHTYLGSTGSELDSDLRDYLSWIRDAYTTYEGSGTAKKIFITEIGWRSDGNGEQYQANNLTTAFNVTLNTSYVSVTTWFFLRDQYDWNEKWGLLREDGNKKLAWYEFADNPPGNDSVHLDVFARGTDNNIYHRWQLDGPWSGWESLGAPPGGATSDPSAVCWGSGRVDLFVRGGDYALWHKWFNGSYWGSWVSLGGYITSAPDAASWGAGHIDVFVRGGDNALYYKRYQNGYWSGWQWLGGVLTSGPSAVSPKANQVYVFVRGGDNALYYRQYLNGYWYDWQWLGGGLQGSPDAASWGENHLDVFVRGNDNYLYHRWTVGGSWSGWESLGTPPGLVIWGSPGAVSPLYNRVDAFVCGSDNKVWHRYFNGSYWGGWEKLDGLTITGGPDAASWSLQK